MFSSHAVSNHINASVLFDPMDDIQGFNKSTYTLPFQTKTFVKYGEHKLWKQYHNLFLLMLREEFSNKFDAFEMAIGQS